MNNSKWMVCLDLSQMDEVLIGYSHFLSEAYKPSVITFLHVVQSGYVAREMVEAYPEVKSFEDLKAILRNEIEGRVSKVFDGTGVETRVDIAEGYPTDQIIDRVRKQDPDLLFVGQKVGYDGEGIVPRRIVKYIPCSTLFVPETSRYQLERALVGVDFSEASAKAIDTACLWIGSADEVTAQHVYRYKAKFFPYAFSDKERKELVSEVERKRDEFLDQYDVPKGVRLELTLLKEGKIPRAIYDVAIREQADLIVIGTKTKKLSRIIRQDVTDKMVDYAFGIPLLVQKDKSVQRTMLRRLFEEGSL
ncbi:MAG: universal stress protein [Balneolaceae bacterium]